ncbi:MAG: hypothetical protein NC924_05620 [Candidatus Omnitrophica bacterium]|nr:hypothetical protein [Candidatus Omnitrophota bacterium]
MKKLAGIIIKGNGAASERFRCCKEILKKYGLNFPPLHFGTINIKLEENYKTPYYGIIVPYHELDEISRKNKEYWQFIPIESINGDERYGFILRTSINIHGEQVAELVTEYIDSGIEKGTRIEMEMTV